MSGQAHVAPHVYRVGLARVQDGVEAWVFDLPGCCALASSKAGACDLLPVVIAEHLAWLDQHGEVTRDAFPFDAEIVEETLSDPCFEADKAPLSADDLEAGRRQLAHSHNDLINLVRPLPDIVLDWRPPASAVMADEREPEARIIREILQHVAGSEGFYSFTITQSFPEHAVGPPVDIFEARQRSLAAIRSLSEADQSAVFRCSGAAGESEWTLRKMLRRTIRHERFHTKEIEQRLAWLLLGTPQTAGTPVRT